MGKQDKPDKKNYVQKVAEDPSGATDCTTQWNKTKVVILLVL